MGRGRGGTMRSMQSLSGWLTARDDGKGSGGALDAISQRLADRSIRVDTFRYTLDTFRYSADTASIQRRYSVDTASIQRRYTIDAQVFFDLKPRLNWLDLSSHGGYSERAEFGDERPRLNGTQD